MTRATGYNSLNITPLSLVACRQASSNNPDRYSRILGPLPGVRSTQRQPLRLPPRRPGKARRPGYKAKQNYVIHHIRVGREISKTAGV